MLTQAERLANAAAKRDKLLQATVYKAKYEVKHAIAVAAASKERERAVAVEVSTNLQSRLAAASERRQELLCTPPSSSISPTSSSTSPGKASAKKSSRERARQVAQAMNDQAVSLEMKRKKLAAAMDKALAVRNDRLEATIRRATMYKDKTERVREAIKEQQASAEELARQIADKGQAAAVRRQLQRRASGKKMGYEVIDFTIQPRAGRAPPTGLVDRLSKTSTPSFSAEERQRAARERREKIIFDKLANVASQSLRHESAAASRATRLQALHDSLVRKMDAAATLAAQAGERRVAFALKSAERQTGAAARRVAKRAVRLAVIQIKSDWREARIARDSEHKALTASAERAASVAQKRAAMEKAALDRAAEKCAKADQAAARRAALLAARVDRAKLSAKLNAKRSARRSGRRGAVVEDKVILCAAPDESSRDAVPDEDSRAVVEEESPFVMIEDTAEFEGAEEVAENKGVISRVFGIFGF